MKRDIDLKLISTILITLLISSMVIYSITAIIVFNNHTAEKQTEDIAKVIQKAAIQCYALEGSYPPDIYYIADNYGVIIEEDLYIYHYEVYGSNIMPHIQVFYK